MRYDVYYKGEFFFGEEPIGSSGYFEVHFDRWSDAIDTYNHIASYGVEVYLHDNEYDVTLHDDEWR